LLQPGLDIHRVGAPGQKAIPLEPRSQADASQGKGLVAVPVKPFLQKLVGGVLAAEVGALGQLGDQRLDGTIAAQGALAEGLVVLREGLFHAPSRRVLAQGPAQVVDVAFQGKEAQALAQAPYRSTGGGV